MWVYASEVLFEDEQLPELAAGDTLRGIGIRATAWSVRASTRELGLHLRRDLDPVGRASVHYDIDAELGSILDSQYRTLDVGGATVVADDTHIPGGLGADGRLTMHATLSVLWEHDYEGEPAELQGIRRDWIVDALVLEIADLEYQEAGFWAVSAIRSRRPVQRIHQWSPKVSAAQSAYLLRLRAPDDATGLLRDHANSPADLRIDAV